MTSLRCHWAVAVLAAGSIVGCAAAEDEVGSKQEQPAPYYGMENGDGGKVDSAHKPASIEPIAFGLTKVASFTPSEQFRAFTFSGYAGQQVDLYADGLEGLDTMIYLYRVSANTGRPYGWPIARNDDTSAADWMLDSNLEPNPWSSNVLGFVLPEDRTYALVVTTFWQLYDGTAEVVVKTPDTGKTCAGFANIQCPDGQVCVFPAYMCKIPDMAGTCTVPPAESGFSCSPPNPNVDNRVCGCDGQTYVDSCHARMLGASIASDGPCP